MKIGFMTRWSGRCFECGWRKRKIALWCRKCSGKHLKG